MLVVESGVEAAAVAAHLAAAVADAAVAAVLWTEPAAAGSDSEAVK